MWLTCPYLGAEVELTDERPTHIEQRHPELLPEQIDRLIQAIADPDRVLVDGDYPNTRLLARWYDDLAGGKHVVAAVVSTPQPPRHWIVTAMLVSRELKGDLQWTRP
jgi:hypothetical protein